jgi:hypothetical protein
MAGKKGCSGRKCKIHEDMKDSVIEKSWEICHRFLTAPHISLDRKVEIACRISVKAIPTDFSSMPKPENHVHINMARINSMTREELLANLLGRGNGNGSH